MLNHKMFLENKYIFELDNDLNENKYMLFTGWEVRIGKNCARGLERPRAVLKAEGTVFPYTDRPKPVNNIFICFCLCFCLKKNEN